MPESTFTFRVDEELKAAFAAAAKANDRTGAQVLRDVMRDYVAEKALPSPERIEWMNGKLNRARADVAAGRIYTNEDMKARMAARRNEWFAQRGSGKAA